ncbi:MAG TPA: universal stress protein [Bacteroidota bacterium]|nr:universal stress protein [Bacteroidota bacterium]
MSVQQTTVVEYATSRPRVLGWIRSAAILDGDWGTSIAYVLGIGFALAGYSSFWHLMAMLALTTLVAVNYITICRLYPKGGGVYSSVYGRSKTWAVIGALLLSADYVVTIALSILDAAHYFGIHDPLLAAIVIILGVGVFNWYGPKHTGAAAIFISLAAVGTLLVIMIASLPTTIATTHIERPSGTFFANWEVFVGIILSISGIEAVSNMTGLMKDPARDSRRAILSILTKVVLATVFLTLAMHAIPAMSRLEHKEEMLRFLGESYIAPWFGWVVAGTIGFLLISAGNTALNALISIQFLMSVDHELPAPLRKLNANGVPIMPLAVSTIVPIIVLLFVNDVLTLAQLYAIGVVGAILINVGSTATDLSLKLPNRTRLMMLVSAAVLFLIEGSIIIDKPKATVFITLVLIVGLSARYLAQRKPVVAPAFQPGVAPSPVTKRRRKPLPSVKYLLAMKDMNDRLLNFAVEEAKIRNALLFVLRIKEVAVGLLPERLEMETNGAEKHISEVCERAGIDFQSISVPSNEVGYTITEYAATFGVERVIVGPHSRNLIESVLRGSTIRSVSSLLPEEIQLVIFGG